MAMLAVPRGKNKYRNEVELKTLMARYDEEIGQLKPQHEKILKKSRRYAKGMLTLGLVGLCSQWVFIGAGTFYFYCWDVMEPIAYIMQLCNLALGYGVYTFANQEFEIASIHDSLVDRKKNRLYMKLGLDSERYNYLQKSYEEIREELYNLP